MKPVNFNQLLFHPRTVTLSIFFAPRALGSAAHEDLLDKLSSDLRAAGRAELLTQLESSGERIKQILQSHPTQGHGFFFSTQLQGYMVIDAEVENYFILGQAFHVRPLLEELSINPEYVLVNADVTEVRVFRGDFRSLEIQSIFELSLTSSDSSMVYAPMSTSSLARHKFKAALRGIGRRIAEGLDYEELPVLVSGSEGPREVLVNQFREASREVIELTEDFQSRACLEVIELCKPHRPAILDFHSRVLVEKIRRMIKQRRLIFDLALIIEKLRKEAVTQLILPARVRIFGTIDWETGRFELHAPERGNSVDLLNELVEELIRQEGRIIILPQHFFPAGTQVLAVIKD